jgi:prevent-host-death family protein
MLESEMSKPAARTEAMAISDVKAKLSSLVNKVYRGETRVLIEKSGIPVAALVSVEDLQQLARMDEEDREAWAVLEAMRAPFRDVPLDEIEREAAKAIAEVGAELCVKREPAATKSAKTA